MKFTIFWNHFTVPDPTVQLTLDDGNTIYCLSPESPNRGFCDIRVSPVWFAIKKMDLVSKIQKLDIDDCVIIECELTETTISGKSIIIGELGVLHEHDADLIFRELGL